ncbi:MAG: UDP-N-acetylglucosamine 1-carboxyvinyltransferase [Victivallales bacterium]|nr:UDP-N-acetylglucosamine 1-carboxyvinyltransferase [Victivallales bacterium]
MKALSITGGRPVCGELQISGNKNAALPMIAAAMLADEPVILNNVPDILDVRNMLKVVESLGARAEFTGGRLVLDASGLSRSTIPVELCHAVRTSLLFAGPLVYRCGEAAIAPPGGDVIGRRRLDTHFYGLNKLGITAWQDEDNIYRFRRDGALKGADLFLDEPSVTATEHIMTVAAVSSGVTVIRNAACEPHVRQLAALLNSMGARITGVGTNLLQVEGVEKLHGGEITIAADHVNAASFLALAAATGGNIDLYGEIVTHDYWMTRRIFERLDARFEMEPGHISMHRDGRPLKVVREFDGQIPTISDGPWPQFPSDMMSCLIAAATQAEGSVLFFEKMFESRIYFVDRLIAMGANAVICDPHRAVISGPATLRGAEVISPDIRAGMALVIAAAVARGKSLIRNADMVYRGYDRLPQSLAALGVDIREVEM